MKKFLLVILIFFFAGCSPSAEQMPTLEASPLADPSTELIITPEPSATSQATPTPEPIPTEAPTIDPTYLNFPTSTATPNPTPIPSDLVIQLSEPGPQSKVVSPIKVVAYIHREYVGTTLIELFGEDGRLVYRKVTKTYPYVGVPTLLKEEIEFELRGAAESGRLSISTVDDHGRVQAINSVPLLLMSLGSSEIMPVNQPRERVVLAQPKAGFEVRAGEVVVEGEFLPYADAPVILELVEETGKIISSRLLYFDLNISGYQAFFATVPYTVYAETPVRLVIRQDDRSIPGIFYLFSRELILYP
jgi:hypothetical protein